MKQLIFVGGPMGVGKTTVCGELKKALSPSVYLDGDWCWDMNPFLVNEETKTMVMDHITYLLRSFLMHSSFQYVILSWVMHEQSIIDELLSRLSPLAFQAHCFSLVCSQQQLRARLQKDIDAGRRTPDVIHRSLSRLACYDSLQTLRLDVSQLTPSETCRLILSYLPKG